MPHSGQAQLQRGVAFSGKRMLSGVSLLPVLSRHSPSTAYGFDSKQRPVAPSAPAPSPSTASSASSPSPLPPSTPHSSSSSSPAARHPCSPCHQRQALRKHWGSLSALHEACAPSSWSSHAAAWVVSSATPPAAFVQAAHFHGTGRALAQTYYEVLGVPQDADPSKIKKAYFGKARTMHPDVNKAPNAKEEFVKITEAYEVLKDASKRRQYDLSLRMSGGKHQTDGGFGGGPGFGGFGGPGGGFQGGFSDRDFERWMRDHEQTMEELFKAFGKGGFNVTFTQDANGPSFSEQVQRMGAMAELIFNSIDATMFSPHHSERMSNHLKGKKHLDNFYGELEVIERIACEQPYLEIWGKGKQIGGIREHTARKWTLELPKGEILSTVLLDHDTDEGVDTINVFHGNSTRPEDFFAVVFEQQGWFIIPSGWMYSDGSGQRLEVTQHGWSVARKFKCTEMTMHGLVQGSAPVLSSAVQSVLDLFPMLFRVTVSHGKHSLHPFYMLAPVAHHMFQSMRKPSVFRKVVKFVKGLFMST
eukprot:TRINITY_DN6468_c0_g1_i2.p1 TRINITY_DN6468_c0_g1~~TRINITY_DN6468_c0_g1_i2.p1  ORF type:complete len:585 (+),score=122.35 TRINITY_DN6468_c0_g1_i2:168-1757(+)